MTLLALFVGSAAAQAVDTGAGSTGVAAPSPLPNPEDFDGEDDDVISQDAAFANQVARSKRWTDDASKEHYVAIDTCFDLAKVSADERKSLNAKRGELEEKALALTSLDAGDLTAEKLETARQFQRAEYGVLLFHKSDDQRHLVEMFDALLRAEGEEAEKRRGACGKVFELATGRKNTAPKAGAGEKEAFKDALRDLFRLTAGDQSGAMTGGGLVERPGAPRAMALGLMLGLGGEQKAQGTQLVTSLNLARIFLTPSQLKKQSAFVRHLFVRASVPMAASDAATSLTGSDSDPAESGATPAAEMAASRYSFVLGSSFLDDSDPTILTNEKCYELALTWVPHVADNAASAAREANALRDMLLDACAKRAAANMRWAVRLGIGLIDIDATETSKAQTKLEQVAGVLVLAPSDWLNFSSFYQRVWSPSVANAYGLQASLGRNIATDRSNSIDVFARVMLDATYVLYEPYQQAQEHQLRVAGAVVMRVMDGVTLKLAVGPRVIWENGTPTLDVMGNVSFGYDADELLDSVMNGGLANL